MSNFFNESVSNPVTVWGEFRGKAGNFRFWDKNADEGEEQAESADLAIFPLFIHSGVAGFHKRIERSMYSNEVQNLKTDELVVKCNSEEVARGVWNDIKDKVVANGGKFANIVYGMRIVNNGTKESPSYAYDLVALKFSGVALGSWLDARVNAGQRKYVFLTKGEYSVSGDNEFYKMKVVKGRVNDEFTKHAYKYATQLKEYFDYYFSDKKEYDEITLSQQGLSDASTPLMLEGKDQRDIDAEIYQASMEEQGIEDMPF